MRNTPHLMVSALENIHMLPAKMTVSFSQSLTLCDLMRFMEGVDPLELVEQGSQTLKDEAFQCFVFLFVFF